MAEKFDVVTELNINFVFLVLRYRFVQLMAITFGSFVVKFHTIVNEQFINY